MSLPPFSQYSKLYDLFNFNKNYSEESAYIMNLLNTYSPESKNILEFGSGTGIHASYLIDHGYSVHGIEKSPQMAANSIQKKGFTCEQGDITNLSLGSKYDSIVSLFHVISYQVDDSDLFNTFETAFMHLNSGGVFIFDVWYSPAVYHIQPSVRIRHAKNSDLEAFRISNPFMKGNIVDVNFDFFYRKLDSKCFQHFTESHRMRHFTSSEILFIANKVGFEFLHSEEFLTSREPSPSTWGVTFVLRKV